MANNKGIFPAKDVVWQTNVLLSGAESFDRADDKTDKNNKYTHILCRQMETQPILMN